MWLQSNVPRVVTRPGAQSQTILSNAKVHCNYRMVSFAANKVRRIHNTTVLPGTQVP